MKWIFETVAHQRRYAHNLQESPRVRCSRFWWAVVYMVKAVRVGLRTMGKECLGSAVLYEGRRLHVSNWAGSESPTLAGDGVYIQHADRSAIRPIRSVGEYLHRFRFGCRFYSQNWLGIDVNRRLYPELAGPSEGSQKGACG